MTADWLQGLRGTGSGRNTWKADVPDRSVPAPALWAGAPGARMHFSVGLLCGLHCGIHASTLAHSGRPKTLFSQAFCRSKKWRMGELTGGEGGIRTHDAEGRILGPFSDDLLRNDWLSCLIGALLCLLERGRGAPRDHALPGGLLGGAEVVRRMASHEPQRTP
jgi:hypothetical protein